MNSIKLISKKGCGPCFSLERLMLSKLKENSFEKITFDTDDEVLSYLEPFGLNKVPVVILNDKVTLGFLEMYSILGNIKSS